MTLLDDAVAVETTTVTTRLVIPGGGALEFRRDRGTSALLGVTGGGRTYLHVDASGTWHWGDLATTREERRADGMTRHVHTTHGDWSEHYRWDGAGLTEVDGVVIRRDSSGRVVACLPGGSDPAPTTHRWIYAPSDGAGIPAHVTGPFGVRTIGADADGRVRTWHEGGVNRTVEYDRRQHRRGVYRPRHDHVDDGGRCWASVNADGAIGHVFIWDGTRCLARIDGPVGAPVAAVFSLDPSATPVRIITPAGTIRVPRDAYGEGLLAHRDVPGLFGGQQHGGLVHLPLRRLDPVTGSFLEPDPYHGGDDDLRRGGAYEGPLPTEPDPRSAYEVCRGDPVGRADPTGGVSAGLIISDLTWSFQNNLLSFFGIDWWFNLFGTMLTFGQTDAEFFSTTGLTGSEGHGGFGLRRGGIINEITGGRAFTTQHIVWSPDDEYALLERGEVVDPGGPFTPTHYGTLLSIIPSGHPPVILASMHLTNRAWVSPNAAPSWSRHGGVGVPTAPGTLSPWFPTGGVHLDAPLQTTRHDTSCPMTELEPAAVATGELESRTFLTASATTGLSVGDVVLADDGTTLVTANVIGLVPDGTGQRVQLDIQLAALTGTGISLTELAPPASSTLHDAGTVPNSLDVHGTPATYAPNDVVRLTATTGEVTVARVGSLEASLPLDRPLSAGLTGPIAVALGSVSGAATLVTMAGSDLDFGPATRPGVGATGIVSAAAGTEVAVRVTGQSGAAAVTLDIALPAAITGALIITYRPVTSGSVLGSRAGNAEPGSQVTYTPNATGVALDGSAGLVLVRCESGGQAHARIVTGPPIHDVVVLDRPFAGTGPFTSERLPTVGGPVANLLRADVVALFVGDPARFSSAPAVFLSRVAGQPPAPVTVRLAGVDVVAGVVQSAPAAGSVTTPDLEPGRPMLVGNAVRAIRTVRVTVGFGPAVDLGDDPLQAVLLGVTGNAYLGDVIDARTVVAQPQVNVGGAPVDAPFPRFLVGDVVRVTDRAGANPTWHRITVVDGGRLTLTGGPPLNPGDLIVVEATITLGAATGTADPLTGGPMHGIDGARVGANPATAATFSVWTSNVFPTGAAIGIVDGGVTHPVVVDNTPQDIEVTFSESFDAAGVDVTTIARVLPAVPPAGATPGVTDGFRARLTLDGAALLLVGPISELASGPAESVIAVAYQPVGPTTTGTIGSGSMLVPEREGVEVDRSQSLTDHELTHTLQYARFGPLWFNIFPMLAMELPGILATDTELPEYSAFFDGTVGLDDGLGWKLTVPDTHGVTLAVDDELQVVQGAQRFRAMVHSINGEELTVRTVSSGTPQAGEASVRKLQRRSSFDEAYAFFDLLTHGGILNLFAGTTWGGIFWCIGKLAYGLGRAIGGTGELYPAAVTNEGAVLTLTTAVDVDHIKESGRVVVRQGDNTVVRSMTRADTAITLAEPVTFTGDVQVAMYDTHNPEDAFDWYNYYPATVDADNPFSIQIGGVDGHVPNLEPEDRIVVRYRDNKPRKTDVLAVSGDIIELADPVNIVGGELSLRIAKVGASDPLGNADSAAMVDMGMGWMKWVFDPYGQIEVEADPTKEWSTWLLRVMRWLLGTQNFSLLPGGYLWWGRLIPLFVGPEHVTRVEQEASEKSGDLYSPLGRLLGQRTSDSAYSSHRMVVGDVARYRHWSIFRNGTYVMTNLIDSPGVHYTLGQRVMPNRSNTGPGALQPNRGTIVGPAPDPGAFVADVFSTHGADPRAVPGPDPLGFTPALLGNVPVPARTERMLSCYVAFTRPGNHRATVINDAFNAAGQLTTGLGSAQAAVDAFDREHQTMWFEIGADDVDVRMAGLIVDLSTPGTTDVATMVPFQTASVVVTPNASRAYRVSVPDPTLGATLRTGPGSSLVAVAVSPDAVPVEVSRFYAASAAGGFGPGGLANAGVHLSRSVDIPVRRFTVNVVDTLALRDTLAPTDPPLATLAVGVDAFLLVPAPIVRPPTVVSVAGAPPAAGAVNPVTPISAGIAADFVGVAGAAFTVNFAPGAPVGDTVMRVDVGTSAAAFATLTIAFTLTS